VKSFGLAILISFLVSFVVPFFLSTSGNGFSVSGFGFSVEDMVSFVLRFYRGEGFVGSVLLVKKRIVSVRASLLL